MHADIESVALEIIRYFLQRPDAADTLEGIARWRLMQQTIDRTIEETLAAVRLLIERGQIEEMRLAGGAIVFRLLRDKATDAEPRGDGGGAR